MRNFNPMQSSPGRGNFFDILKGKIGNKKFGNKLHFIADVFDNWISSGVY